MGVLDGRRTSILTREAWHPQCIQSCKDIDHDEGALAFFRFQCHLNYLYTKLAKFLAKIVENFPNIKFPRLIFEHSYSKHNKEYAVIKRQKTCKIQRI